MGALQIDTLTVILIEQQWFFLENINFRVFCLVLRIYSISSVSGVAWKRQIQMHYVIQS